MKQFFKHLNKRTTIQILFICLVICAAFWQFIHKSAQQKILQVDLERQKLSKINENILNYSNKYGNLDNYMQKLEERFQLSIVTLPERMQQGEFISFLQKTALENQVNIISLNQSAIQLVNDKSLDSDSDTKNQAQNNNAKLNKLPISLKIECQYVSLINFLKTIEASERLMNIQDLSIISKGNGDWLTCELDIVIFSFEED